MLGSLTLADRSRQAPTPNNAPAAAEEAPIMSDEVSQFLEQVEQLRGKQIEDDQLRAREREEFMAAKRERQARREGESSSLSLSMPDPEVRNAACTMLARSCKETRKITDPKKTSRDQAVQLAGCKRWLVCLAAGSWQKTRSPHPGPPSSNRAPLPTLQ